MGVEAIPRRPRLQAQHWPQTARQLRITKSPICWWWWVRARLSTVIDTPGLSLATVADQITSGGIDFDIEQAAGTGDFLPLARPTLRHVDPACDDIAFDPALHSDPEVKLVPGWLGDFRRAAYRRGRQRSRRPITVRERRRLTHLSGPGGIG